MPKSPTIDEIAAPNVDALASALSHHFPIFKKAIATRLDEFGASWLERFEHEIATSFAGDKDAITRAAKAYGAFSLEAMRLQAKFDLTLRYDASSYEQAVSEVYSNVEYMVSTYLPALLLSHYLWPHHYRQLHWAHEHFIDKLRTLDRVRFCDVGIGTGFYSKEILAALPNANGWGFDISSASISHTKELLTKWCVMERYELHQNYVAPLANDGFNAFVTVELLEHLEDPQAFLCSLREAVQDNALGFITAAIDAPNRDHIYLYRDLDSIAKQINKAGFEILKSHNFPAYETKSQDETAPQSGCFIVRAVVP
ncbi:MAG: class I SAM-dependent methyltransferase [Magnetovibrio sp.]|nr:class I SAM-dependent methyltransferase [Magnetovibrio sp.]